MGVLANIIWMVLQAALFLDLLFTYLSYYARRVRRSVKKSSAKFIGSSSFDQPASWSVITRCLKFDLQPRGYLLLLSVLLPINVIFFYLTIGTPFFTEPRLQQNDGQLILDTWPEGGGFRIDVGTWIIYNSSSNDIVKIITGQECYEPGKSEYIILRKLREEDMPKQAYCESTLGWLIADWRRSESAAEWQHDDDVWEELFNFTVRMFGSLAGIVADQLMDSHRGGFMEDMTDVFDMYMMTFIDVTQMHEGRKLLQRKMFFNTLR